MKNLKTLGLSFVLVCVLAVAAFAGETSSPPCAPGEVNSPPCPAAAMTLDGSAALGEVNSPPAPTAGAYSIAEAALDLLQSGLLIF